MDQEVLVSELKKLRNKLVHKEGPLVLLMLLASDPDVDDAWNLVVSAKGLDHTDRAEALKVLTKLLRETTNESIWNQIIRATILRTDDPFVRAVTNAFSTKNNELNLQSTKISGYDIPRAIVLESQRAPATT